MIHLHTLLCLSLLLLPLKLYLDFFSQLCDPVVAFSWGLLGVPGHVFDDKDVIGASVVQRSWGQTWQRLADYTVDSYERRIK